MTPKKARGRSPSLSSEDVDKFEEFIKESPENRQMTYFELANGPFKHLGVSERVIKSELEKRGFKRYIAQNDNQSSNVFTSYIRIRSHQLVGLISTHTVRTC